MELSPADATYHNGLAWVLATCPDPSYRDEHLAAKHAAKAVELAPTNHEAWNTLGVARYRCGEWQLAIEALTKAEELKPGTYFAHNAFFLAMAHWKLDEKDAARSSLEQAVQWMSTSNLVPSVREELEQFRVEAEELLK